MGETGTRSVVRESVRTRGSETRSRTLQSAYVGTLCTPDPVKDPPPLGPCHPDPSSRPNPQGLAGRTRKRPKNPRSPELKELTLRATTTVGSLGHPPSLHCQEY